jgi:hypothetical protein
MAGCAGCPGLRGWYGLGLQGGAPYDYLEVARSTVSPTRVRPSGSDVDGFPGTGGALLAASPKSDVLVADARRPPRKESRHG